MTSRKMTGWFNTRTGSRWHHLRDGRLLCGRSGHGGPIECELVDELPPGEQACRFCTDASRRDNPPHYAAIWVLDIGLLANAIRDHGGVEWVATHSRVSSSAMRKWLTRSVEPGVLSLVRVCEVCHLEMPSLILSHNGHQCETKPNVGK